MTTAAQRGSLRRQITLSTSFAVSVVIAAAGFWVLRAVEARVVSASRGTLQSLISIGHIRAASAALVSVRRGEALLPEFGGQEEAELEWLVRQPDGGGVLAGSLGFPGVELDALLPGPDGTSEIVYRDVVSETGEPWRVAGFVCRPADDMPPEARGGMRNRGGDRPGPEGRGPRGRPGGQLPLFGRDARFEVFVATSIAEEQEELSTLAKLLGVAGLLAVLTSALLIRALVSAGLRPLGALSSQVAALEADRLDVTLSAPGAPAELVPIVEALDSARARLASAFDRERRFTADAAHELRTPLAGLRSTLEVALRRERSPEEHRAAAQQCLDITLSMQDTVTTLLELARTRGDIGPGVVVVLAPEVRTAFEEHAARASSSQLTVHEDVVPGLRVMAQPALLERVLFNVAQNALDHALPGSRIEVSTGQDGGSVFLAVSNDCEELPPDAGERALEPFWRADVARTDHGAHAGLGLALVEQCMRAMGGRVAVTTGRGDAGRDRFTITLWLPAASPAAPDGAQAAPAD